MNLRNSLHTGDKAHKRGIHPGFETQWRHRQKSKIGVSVAPRKGLTSSKNKKNKKVLLCERKRHTTRCVANTPYVVLTGYPPGGYPDPPPHPRGGTWSGTPPGGYPVRYPDPPGGVTRSGTPLPGGYPDPPTPGGVPGQVPPGGYPDPPGGVPGQVPPGGVRVPPGGYPVRYPPRGGTRTPPPPPVDRQTPVKTVPSRRTTYAGGNKSVNFLRILFC